MTQYIGDKYRVLIPSLSDDASVVEAFQYYHLGSTDGIAGEESIDKYLSDVNDRVGVTETDIDSVNTRVDNVETNISNLGSTYISRLSTTALPNAISPQTGSVVPLTINGASVQTANLQQWKTSDLVVAAKVDNLGKLYSFNGTSADEVITLSSTQTMTNKTLTSPTLTGTPISTTPAVSTNNTQIATTAFVKSAIGTIETNSQSTLPYSPALSDIGKMIEMGSGATITIQPNSSVPFPIGSSFSIMQTTATTVSILGASGVTINATPGFRLRTQWSVATVIKRATDTWILFGDLMI